MECNSHEPDELPPAPRRKRIASITYSSCDSESDHPNHPHITPSSLRTHKRQITKTLSTPTMSHSTSTPAALTWPPGRLPYELFLNIAKYLPRSSIQHLRLVSREFESKLSTYLFRAVVVPFRHEIYDIKSDPDEDVHNKEIVMRDKGMRVFQGFGGHISKFAMSFELDLQQLYQPPNKSDQEFLQAFWGEYAWPFPNYHRFESLAWVEDVADETKTMTKALQFITKATELALSVDGGLGWLNGPDVNMYDPYPAVGPKVFGSSRFCPEDPLLPEGSSFGRSSSSQHSTVIQGTDSTETAPDVVPAASIGNVNGFDAQYNNETLHNVKTGCRNRRADPVVSLRLAQQACARFIEQPLSPARWEAAHQSLAKAIEAFPLKPESLTVAQKEMLLETEWAQRAFIQSWSIAVTDNRDSFKYITKLNMARLPAIHLCTLNNEDFWSSLQNLQEFCLGVVPDCREIVKDPSGYIEDNRLKPSKAAVLVYHLLRDHVGTRKNITRLTFEWLFGGEFATGIYSRNDKILPAPIVESPSAMVRRNAANMPVLRLPYVKRLIFKNCWSSPHVLTSFLRGLQRGMMEKLVLVTVSICAPIQAGDNPQASADAAEHPVAHAVVHGVHQPGGPAANHGTQGHAAIHAMPGWGGPFAAFAAAATAAGLHQHLHPFVGHVVNTNPVGSTTDTAASVPLATVAFDNGSDHLSDGHVTNTFMAQPPPDDDLSEMSDASQEEHDLSAVQQEQDVAINISNHPLAHLEQPNPGSWADIIDVVSPTANLAEMRHNLDQRSSEPLRRSKKRLNTIIFRSCGYVAVQLPFPQVRIEDEDYSPERGTCTKRSTMLHPYMMKMCDHYLATVANHIPMAEAIQLEQAWGLSLGWDAAMSAEWKVRSEFDGIRRPGKGRFRGMLTIDPKQAQRGELDYD